MTSLISVFGWSDTETARVAGVCVNILVQDGVYDPSPSGWPRLRVQ
jgi:hypothetical protein